MKKKRSSVWTSAWAVRETSYRKECEDVAYRGRYRVVVRDGIVYQVDNSGEVVLLRPINPKRMWFETGCVLTGRAEPPAL